MAGDGHADLLPGQLLQLRREPVGHRRVRHGLARRLEFLFAHGRLLAADRALRDRDDREALAVLRTLFDGLRNLFRGIRDLRDDDDVRARSDARVQRQPAGLVAHDLDDEHARVGKSGRMDGVDDLRGDVHRRLEAEGQLRPPQVVVDGLGRSRFAVLCVPLPPRMTRQSNPAFFTVFSILSSLVCSLSSSGRCICLNG